MVVTEGLTTKLLAVLELLHTTEEAPVAFSVNELPLQIVPLLKLRAGAGITVRETGVRTKVVPQLPELSA